MDAESAGALGEILVFGTAAGGVWRSENTLVGKPALLRPSSRTVEFRTRSLPRANMTKGIPVDIAGIQLDVPAGNMEGLNSEDLRSIEVWFERVICSLFTEASRFINMLSVLYQSRSWYLVYIMCIMCSYELYC
jgi:hypothetical protein